MADKKNIVIRVNYPKSGNRTEKPVSAPEVITEWNIKRIVLALGALSLLIAIPFFVIQKEDLKTNVSAPAALPESAKTTLPAKESDPVEKHKTESEAPELIASNPALTNESETESASAKLAGVPSISSEDTLIIRQSKSSDKKASIKAKETVKGKALIKEKEPMKDRSLLIDTKLVSRALLTLGIRNKEPVGQFKPPVKVGNKQPVILYYFTELKQLKDRPLYHEWLRNGKLVAKHQLYIGADRWRTSSKMSFSERNKGNWTVRLLDDSGQVLNKQSFTVMLDK